MTSTTRKVRATNLGVAGWTDHGVLADGGLILRLSVQREWVYVKFIRPDGTTGRRRYRHDQMVEVEAHD